MISRRQLLAAGIVLPGLSGQAAETDVAALLREGGVVIAFRHALAPGTFDPPGFKLGNCSTKRNISDEGRGQAQCIGTWFKAQGLQPAQVRSSPWCRCMDTATIAFGTATAWPSLGSPRGVSPNTNTASLRELRAAVVAAAAKRGLFEVWVTHTFVLSDMTPTGTSSGEALVLCADDGAQQVRARLSIT